MTVKKAEPKRKVGRPKFQINYKTVEGMAAIMCTQMEIASVLGCSVDTLQRDKKFREIYKQGQDKGRSSLRRLQWDNAQQGNVTMQIWLGKNMLQQSDRAELRPDDEDESEKLAVTYKVKEPKGNVNIVKGSG
jgi:hypothetical protein